MAPERIRRIVAYILEHFDQKTKRNGRSFAFHKLTNITEVASAKRGKKEVEEQKQKVQIQGFNSLYAVSSIEAAKLYYLEFKRQMEELPPDRKLKVATIFSYGANEAEEDYTGYIDDENSENTDALDKSSRDFLESAIKAYNALFKPNYATSADKFQNYYKDVSLRM